MKLLLPLILLAGAAMAKPTVTPINYNQATIAFLSQFIPFTPGFAPRLDVFVTDDDIKVAAYRITIITSTTILTRVVESVTIDGKSYGYISIPGELYGTISVFAEALHGSGEVSSATVPQ